MSQRNKLSCIFWYAKKAFRFNNATGKTEPVLNPDGSARSNDNYISFLQVISCYWEPTEDTNNPNNLNIFLNGGSVSVDRDGNRQMKAGYTVVLPEFIGKKFLDQFWEWGQSFGLVISAPSPVRTHEPRERSEAGRSSRSIRVDDFVDPTESIEPTAAFEV